MKSKRLCTITTLILLTTSAATESFGEAFSEEVRSAPTDQSYDPKVILESYNKQLQEHWNKAAASTLTKTSLNPVIITYCSNFEGHIRNSTLTASSKDPSLDKDLLSAVEGLKGGIRFGENRMALYEFKSIFAGKNVNTSFVQMKVDPSWSGPSDSVRPYAH